MAGRQEKRCFVLAVIGQEGSPERQHSDAVLEKLVKPVLADLGYVAFRGDEFHEAVIIESIIENLASAQLVIADLTFANPNVMFELGVRLAWCLPVIVIAHQRTKLPFDARHFRVILYQHPRRKAAQQKAQEELRRRIRAVERRYRPPGDFHRYFREVVPKHLFYDELRLALEDLVASLDDVAWEVENESSPGRRHALRVIGGLIGAPFAILEDKIHVLRGQSRRIGVSTALKRTFDDVGSILAKWKAFNEALTARRPSTKAINWVVGQLAEFIDLANSVIETVPP